jgi:hypothetical protein
VPQSAHNDNYSFGIFIIIVIDNEIADEQMVVNSQLFIDIIFVSVVNTLCLPRLQDMTSCYPEASMPL